jgi:hypothetical protein
MLSLYCGHTAGKVLLATHGYDTLCPKQKERIIGI